MKCLIVLMVICCLASANPFGHNSPFGARIIGGEETDNHQYPFQVLIYFANTDGRLTFCGGVLVSLRDIITAAHCVDKVTNATVFLGVHSLAGMPRKQRYGSRRFFIHPRFNRNTVQNNLAIIKLSQDVIYDEKVYKARLQCTNESLIGQNATVLGWGKMSNNITMAPALRSAELEIIDNKKCTEAFRTPIVDTQICQDTRNGKTPCDGDAGGGIVIDDGFGYVVIGITSYGCELGKPVVGTKIFPERSWINGVIATL